MISTLHLCSRDNWKRREGTATALRAEDGVSAETCPTQEYTSEALSFQGALVIQFKSYHVSQTYDICQETVILDMCFSHRLVLRIIP